MIAAGTYLRRGRRLAAKSYRLGKRAAAQFGSASKSQAAFLAGASRGSGRRGDGCRCFRVELRGVGRAIASAFAEAGASVIVNGRDISTAERTAAEIGHGAVGVAADVSTEIGVQRILSAALDQFGRIDVVVNNAGVALATGKPAWEVSPEELQRSLAVNLTGPFLLLRGAVRHWLDTGSAGRVLNVSSGAGEQAFQNLSAYGISKYALEGLTRYAATDLGARGVAIASVKLGSLKTAMTKALMPWEDYELLPEPESAAQVFVQLASVPLTMIHGRSFVGPRLQADFAAEALVAGPLSTYPAIEYPKLMRNGEEIARDWQSVTLLDRAENQLASLRE